MGYPDDIDERYHALPLYRERFVAVMPTHHRLANQSAVHVTDLNDEPYVNRVNCEMGDFASHEFAKRGVSVRVVFRSERDGALAKECVGVIPRPRVVPLNDLGRPSSAILPLVFWRSMSAVRRDSVKGRFSNRASGSSSEPHSVSKWDHTHAGHASLRSSRKTVLLVRFHAHHIEAASLQAIE